MNNLINIRIDGKDIQAQKGYAILKARTHA